MKYGISILIVGFAFFSCEDLKQGNHSVEIRKSLVYVSNKSKDILTQNNTLYYKTKVFSGVLFAINDKSKDTILVENYFNGVLDGVSKKWYSNAQLMEIRHYSSGQKNGKQMAYYENGRRRFEFTAKNDQYEGELNEWNVAGKLIHRATYKNGQEEGAQQMWYDNGKIRANYVIVAGRRYGLLGTKNCKNVSDSIFVVR